MRLLTGNRIVVAALLLAPLALSSCSAPRTAQEPSDIIPAGRGHWVSTDTELVADDLASHSVTLDYGHNSQLNYSDADKHATVGFQAVFHATPLTPPDRCGMDLQSLIVIAGDGTRREVPASGYVIDNSDGQRGFRLVSSGGHLAIPSGATATVYFSAPVVLKDAAH